MKKILFFAVTLFSLISCGKEGEINVPDYVTMKGDSVPTKTFEMTLSSVYVVDPERKDPSRRVKSEATIGESLLSLDIIINDSIEGTYNVGSMCKGTIQYKTFKDTIVNGSKDSIVFKTVNYNLSSGYLIFVPQKEKNNDVEINIIGVSETNENNTISLEGKFVSRY